MSLLEESIKLLRKVLEDGKANKEYINSQQHEFLKVASKAVRRTLSYIRDGNKRDTKTENELSDLWAKVAIAAQPFDSDLAERCYLKGNYWANPDSWGDEEVKKARIEIKRIEQEIGDYFRGKARAREIDIEIEPEPKEIANGLDNGSQSVRAIAIQSAAAELEQIANNFENWAKKERAKYIDPNGVKPPAFTLAQIEDWVNTYLSKQRLVAVFFSHPHLSYDKNSGLSPFLTTYERKEFHLIIDVFRLHMPAIATSLKELYDEFWEDVRYYIECHKRSKKVQQENIPSIGESIENTFWHPPLFLDGTVVSTVKRLRHIAEMAKENLAASEPAETGQESTRHLPKQFIQLEQSARELKKLTSIENCPKSKVAFTQWKIKLEGIINVDSFWQVVDWLRYSDPPLDDGKVWNEAEELWKLLNAISAEEANNYKVLGCVDEIRERVLDLANILLRKAEIAKQRLTPKKQAETEQGNKDTKREREGTAVAHKPWYKKRLAKIIGALVLITTLLINLKTIKEWFYSPRIQTSTSKGRQLPLTNENKLSVSLKEICKDIDSRPLAQRNDTAKQYVGIRIKEERLKLLEIHKTPEEDIYILSMIFPEQSDVSYLTDFEISCSVQKEKYPELNLARQGTQLYVSGKIKEAYAKYIELSDVALRFE